MRRFLLWYLPLAAALGAAIVFGCGFYSFLKGDTGTPVAAPSARQASASAPRATVAPVILGDSLARGTGDETGLGIAGRLAEELKRRKIPATKPVNISVNGSRSADVLKLLESRNVRTVLGQSNLIIVSIGGNDLWGDNARSGPMPDPQKVMNEVMGRVEAIVKTVREASPHARIFVVGLYNPFIKMRFGGMLSPLVTRWNALLMERFANDPNVVVVQTADLFAYRERLSADQFHPSGEGYELIARRIADAV
jgi:lysophospholipase L1-like esterase